MKHPKEYFSEEAAFLRHKKGSFILGACNGVLLGISLSLIYNPITIYKPKMRNIKLLKKTMI